MGDKKYLYIQTMRHSFKDIKRDLKFGYSKDASVNFAYGKVAMAYLVGVINEKEYDKTRNSIRTLAYGI